MKKWKCSVCGYIHDGDGAPDKCPKCSAPKDKFAQLDDAAANLVERSRRSNMLHMRLATLARDMEAACKDGISDNLDPNCIVVFNKALAYSYEIMKLSMTELQGHMGKGMWG